MKLTLLSDYLDHWRPRSQRSWVRNSFACFGYGIMFGTLLSYILIYLFADLGPTVAQAKSNLEQVRRHTYERAVKELEEWNNGRRDQK